ncbi:MAG: hypothetical protein BWZ10_01793 [candidate division BRC1 bacterium ADurb.BinA364]|nr:MAG: hypothetical protein BWZ10_01793 [candidate division BRC1 bacterium ADurb.BinA364]
MKILPKHEAALVGQIVQPIGRRFVDSPDSKCVEVGVFGDIEKPGRAVLVPNRGRPIQRGPISAPQTNRLVVDFEVKQLAHRHAAEADAARFALSFLPIGEQRYFDPIKRLISVSARPPQLRRRDRQLGRRGKAFGAAGDCDLGCGRFAAVRTKRANLQPGFSGPAIACGLHMDAAPAQIFVDARSDEALVQRGFVRFFQQRVSEHADMREIGMRPKICGVVDARPDDRPGRIVVDTGKAPNLAARDIENAAKMQRQRIIFGQTSADIDTQFAMHVEGRSDWLAIQIHIDNSIQSFEAQNPAFAFRARFGREKANSIEPILLRHPFAGLGPPGQPWRFDRAMAQQHVMNHRRHRLDL